MKTGIENTGYQDEDADADKYYVEEGICLEKKYFVV